MRFEYGEWVAEAVCRTSSAPPDTWFTDTNLARDLCSRCPVQNECLFTAMAMESGNIRIEGIWGGLSGIQIRRALAAPSWRRIQKMRQVRSRARPESPADELELEHEEHEIERMVTSVPSGTVLGFDTSRLGA